ncbi:helix-turn-helix domain-containing protein [Haloarchaeobius sp. HME9146]|uniref:helix-turn-helix domain-containing protein n=1 Tax=Haloarchaeobius sp. HME9146 TaxID=2978732 RepID=UPI0021C1D275|nr:helix-turn-helix domain-containing protein [Haloarchaeobius sp. HME9146]MCT9096497.1 helix-turn-helix domain-containing protein [Haloarchaeobius sp. HME9146]
MRSTTVALTWEDTGLHPLYDALATTPDVAVEALHYINPVGDDGYAELIQLRGDLELAREVLQQSSAVDEFEVSESGIAYVHYEASPLMDDLLGVLFDHAVVLEWPVEFVAADGVPEARVTFVGTSHALAEAVAAIPSAITVTLERTGRYRRSTPSLSTVLTERQREILEAAVAAGYYDVPRGTTHRELAAALDLAPGTVSEHLQRIEHNLVTAFVPG